MGSTKGVPHRMWTCEEKMEMVRLRTEENLTPKELHQKFGVNPSMICVWCSLYRRYGAERLKSQNGVKRVENS